jgi:hypothetical protein
LVHIISLKIVGACFQKLIGMAMKCLTREILLSQNEKKKICRLEVTQEISFLQKQNSFFSYASEFYFSLKIMSLPQMSRAQNDIEKNGLACSNKVTR